MVEPEKQLTQKDLPEKAENEWDIPEQYLGHVQEMLDKLNARIVRRNLTPFKITEALRWVEKPRKKPTDEDGVDDSDLGVPYVRLRVEGEEQVVAGWLFIGSIQHKGDSGNVLANAPGQKIPSGYHAAANTNCDHCRVKQDRHETYILQNEKTGEYQQIGGSCLRDFLGLDPKAMLDYNSYFHDLKESLEENERRVSDRFVYHAGHFAATVVTVIRQKGWVSRARAQELQDRYDKFVQPTSAEAQFHAFEFERLKPKPPEEDHIVPSPKDIEISKAAIKWAQDGFGKAPSEISDFEQNAQVVARMDYLDHKSFGIYAAMINSYIREQERAVAAAAAAAAGPGVSPIALKWVGAPGKRIELEVTVTGFRTIAIEQRSFRGPDKMSLYKMADTSGNILTWFTNSAWNLGWEERRGEEWTCTVIGKRFHIKATVKDHKEFRGVPETAVSRVTVIKPLADTDPKLVLKAAVEERATPIERIFKCRSCGVALTHEGKWRKCPTSSLHSQFQCDCGRWLDAGTGEFEGEYQCDKCGKDYNSSGQRLAPRSQWGEETGERY